LVAACVFAGCRFSAAGSPERLLLALVVPKPPMGGCAVDPKAK
jgi:hypothetical protein